MPSRRSWFNFASSIHWTHWDIGGSWRSSWSFSTKCKKSLAWKATTSFVTLFCRSDLPHWTPLRIPARNYCKSSAQRSKGGHISSEMFKIIPTAAVVILSCPWPTWSAWALVRSSNIVSRASDKRGKYCRLRSSLIRVLKQQKNFDGETIGILEWEILSNAFCTFVVSLEFLWSQLLVLIVRPVGPIKLDHRLTVSDPFERLTFVPKA